MRILIFHNWYQQTGGEDRSVRTEMDLLAAHGHDVALFDADNRIIADFGTKLRTAVNVAYSREVYRRVVADLHRRRPDVVHLNNFFPLLTPAVLEACRDRGTPVVHTLRNFRLLCPAATMLRDGRYCDLCLTSSPLNAIRHRCYRGSYAGSAAVAWMVSVHRHRSTFQRLVNRFITLSDFQRDVFARAGFPPEAIVVQPPCTPDPGAADDGGGPSADADSGYALYLGRLTREKGVATLLRAWRDVPIELRVAGDGPLRHLVRAAHRDPRERVTYLGALEPEGVSRALRGARFLVVPSEWSEPFGRVVIEAFAHSVPVLAADSGALPATVSDGVDGLVFRAGDRAALARAATWLATHPDECRTMGRRARETYLSAYTPLHSYRRLMEIYEEAMAAAGPRSRA